MAVTPSAGLLAAANSAAAGVADGQKNAAWCAAIASGIGANYKIVARRDSVVVLDLTMSGALGASSAGLQISDSYAAINTLDVADIDTGTWTLRIEKASDSSVYVQGTLARSGADWSLSDDLNPNLGIALSGMFARSPSLDSVPEILLPGDARAFAWADPNLPFASQPDANLGSIVSMQISNEWTNRTLREVSEPGIVGSGADYSLRRLDDPAGGGKKVFQHRLDNAFPMWNGTARGELSTNAFFTDGEIYWIGLQYYLTSDCFVAGNMMSVADLHHNNWSNGPYGRPSRANQAPLGISMSGNGSAAMGLVVRGCYINDFQASQVVVTSLMSGFTPTVNTWIRFVIQVRLGRNWDANPFIKLWRQVGNGAETLIADRSDVPIGYRDTPANSHYFKIGPYDWRTNPNSPTVTRRTIYTKGMQILKHGAGSVPLNAATMFAALRSL